jgi:hypothetical protein
VHTLLEASPPPSLTASFRLVGAGIEP